MALIDTIRSATEISNEEDNTMNAAVSPEALKAPIASTGSIKIDTDVPLPESVRAPKYPWDLLAVGQSFFVSGGKLATFNTACVKTAKRLEGRKFICRALTENGVAGVRVWRKA